MFTHVVTSNKPDTLTQDIYNRNLWITQRKILQIERIIMIWSYVNSFISLIMQTSTVTNVKFYKRQRRQTSDLTNVNDDKRQI